MIRRRATGLLFICLALSQAVALANDANRFNYLDEFLDPYYVSRSFPKLTTPQWVAKPGVEAVVVLAIDDMRDTAKYENYLRPILERLKKIDGRAPVSIMTNRVDPQDPQLQRWLQEGVSIEVHTYDHPCPCLQKGDFAAARRTYDRCVDLMSQIEGNSPVAFRMPCCDSLNTPSPRFFAEIFNRTTPKAGNFLAIDSSVFQVFTKDDPELPAELVVDEEGQPRFRKYLPFPSFVNTIENYPYPYIIGGKCWQFPCMAPSDWEAQNIQQPNNPRTVRDMKAALDATVIKQGVFNLVFHPHGWIRNDQVIELIEHAQAKHGDKVLFLTFREALEHLNKQLLAGHPIRDAAGNDNGVRMLDLNNDGYLDVVAANEDKRRTRIWSPQERRWRETDFPAAIVRRNHEKQNADAGVRFTIVNKQPIAMTRSPEQQGAWSFRDGSWREDRSLLQGIDFDFAADGVDRGVRFRDLDHDGQPELIVANPKQQKIFRHGDGGWRTASLAWPNNTSLVDDQGRDAGLRFVDINQDGFDDVLFSDDKRYSLHLWNSSTGRAGWSIESAVGERGDENAIPMIVRDGANNGAWFHSETLWIQNEDTHRLADLVERRKYNDLLSAAQQDFPPSKTPEQARRSIKVADGLQVEIAATEPLVSDPIAIDFGFDGSLFVVEMGDYPNGVDDAGGAGGRVKQLWDDDGDGRFDRSSVFVDKLPFPTGVKTWRDGVLITAAPDILFARDIDGDGKADEVKKLYSGFNQGNQQHRVNGLRWGLDNWLYLANGDSGGEIRHVDDDRTVNIRGRDLRIHPDTGRLDPLAGQTQFGRNRDDWGNWFGGNNSNPMWQYLLEDHVTRRNRHVSYGFLRPNVYDTPGASPVFPRSRTLTRFNDFNKSNRFTSACSPIVYRDHALGEAFAGDAFVCEPVHNLVHREKTRYEGARMRSRRAETEQSSEFLASNDNWFRPTMVRTGPDGALWVVDMYRFVIEHPEWIPREWQERLTLRAGNNLGRIYRITPLRKKLAQPRPLASLSRLELVAELESSNGTRRDMAHQQLIWNRDETTVAPLVRVAKESKRPLARMHAICVLAGMEALDDRTLERALLDRHPGVQRWAVYWASRHKNRPFFLSYIRRLAESPDARVRIECAVALGYFGASASAAQALGQLALKGNDDDVLRAAVLSSVHEQNLAAVVEAVARNAAGENNLPALLPPLLAMASALNADEVWRAALGAKNDAPTPLWKLRTAALIAEQLRQRSKNGFEIPSTVTIYRELLAEARRDLVSSKASHDRRVASLRLLGAVQLDEQQNRETLLRVLSPKSPIAIQRAAVQSLGTDGSKPALAALFDAWQAATPTVRNDILDVMLARESWAKELLVRIESKSFDAGQLGPSRRQQLLSHRNAEIRKQSTALFASATPAERLQLIQRYLKAGKREGDVAKGKQLFAKKCATCHRLDGVGHALGPDLAALTNRSDQAMITALLAPNNSVEEKYLTYVVLLNDGRQVQGVLQSETATTLTLTQAESKTVEVLRRDVDSLRTSGKSLMPEGMEKEVPLEEVADLLAYLQRTGPPPKSFPGNNARVVTPRDDGSIHLFVTESRIYGPSVVLEAKYGNLGFWASPNDRAVWSADVPKAGPYRIAIDYACADSAAGNRYLVEVAGQSVGGAVEGTNSWDQYRRMTAGIVTLPKGRIELTFRSDGPINQFLVDLRGIMLHPQ